MSGRRPALRRDLAARLEHCLRQDNRGITRPTMMTLDGSIRAHRIAPRSLGLLFVAAAAALGAGAAWAVDAAALIHPLEWPAAAPAIAPDPKREQFVDQLLASMSLEEKIGQLVQADIGSIRARGSAQIQARFHPGGWQCGAGKRRAHQPRALAGTGGCVLPRIGGRPVAGSCADTDPVRHRCGARSQPHSRRYGISAQRRAGCRQ